jgi:hypothetical protein
MPQQPCGRANCTYDCICGSTRKTDRVATNNGDSYPGKGSPWSDFLHHRARVIDVFIEEGKSPEEIALVLSMDPGQVRLISGRRRDTQRGDK